MVNHTNIGHNEIELQMYTTRHLLVLRPVQRFSPADSSLNIWKSGYMCVRPDKKKVSNQRHLDVYYFARTVNLRQCDLSKRQKKVLCKLTSR
jgi:hypothetical protein